MTQKIHVLVPMSGQGTRYAKAGYTAPKPLVPVNGESMVARLMRNFPGEWPAVFVMADNHLKTALPEELRLLRPTGVQAVVPRHSKGPGLAIMEGLKHIPGDAPVLVTYCDYAMVWDNARFEAFVRDSACDACVVSYRGFHAHYLSPQMYAYSRLDPTNGEMVLEVKEKGSFTSDRESEFASCGAYYFRSADLLKAALEYQFERDISLNGEFYTSLTVEALIRMGADPNSTHKTAAKPNVRVFEIPGFFQWGTPEDLRSFEYWESTFRASNRYLGADMKVGSVLMPMAGAGSRFAGVADAPKPFIDVGGLPMARRALASLPSPEAKAAPVIVSLKAHQSHFDLSGLPGGKALFLDATPPGQALSTEAGVGALAPDADVVVSACDHGIVLDPLKWARFRSKPDCDAAIFTVRGFPGVIRRPQAFAYVMAGAASGADQEFPEVLGVSVKKPVSDAPAGDRLLVGTFWFRNPAVLQKGIDLVKAGNARVNGELYLDSVFELLRSAGHKVRVIDLAGYVNWGDPDSLAEALYWQEVFFGHRMDRRARYPGVRVVGEGSHGK
jgi:NDP-sugar pyrophosphorylase family protein